VLKGSTDGGSEGYETEIVIDNKKIVAKMVTKIKNLTLDIDGDKLAITTGAELFGPGAPSGLSGLVDEVGAYLQGLLAKKGFDAKN
jgi:hypothetical protein